MLVFVFLGVMMGIYGALFCKLNILWARTFRALHVIRKYPAIEVLLVVLTTATIAWYNPYTKLAGTRLVEDLLSECGDHEKFDGLCPRSMDEIPRLIWLIMVAIVVKAGLYASVLRPLT